MRDIVDYMKNIPLYNGNIFIYCIYHPIKNEISEKPFYPSAMTFEEWKKSEYEDVKIDFNSLSKNDRIIADRFFQSYQKRFKLPSLTEKQIKEEKEMRAMLDKYSQFKFIPEKELAKLSTKERQEHLERRRENALLTGKLVAYSLKKGLLDGVITR